MVADCLLALWVISGILVTGIALCRRFSRLAGLDLIGYGAGAGVVFHGVIGLLMSALPALRTPFVVLMIALQIGAAALLLVQRAPSLLISQLDRPTRTSLLLWLSFVLGCIAITHGRINVPSSLPDGMFIMKNPAWMNVKIQQLTELPADNYIPYTVTEFLLRRLSFQNEHPILPGEEVTSRTILMSLVALPFRYARAAPPEMRTLGTFAYIGRSWPDVGKLYREKYYRQFLAVGIVLNSLLLLGLLVLLGPLVSGRILPLAMLCAMTSTFVISQTIYLWPKAFAGFFALLSLHAIRQKGRPFAAGICAALAYNCHPYAMVFVLGLGVWFAWETFSSKKLRPLFEFGLAAGLTILPWLIWTRLCVDLPSVLLVHNLWISGQEHKMPSFVEFVWGRLHNTFRLLAPFFLVVVPFKLRDVIHEYWACLPGAVGLILFLPAFPALLRAFGLRLFLCGVALPGLLLIGCFSNPSIVSLEGYQPIVGLLIFFGVLGLKQSFGPGWFALLCGAQLAMNAGIMVAQSYANGFRL